MHFFKSFGGFVYYKFNIVTKNYNFPIDSKLFIQYILRILSTLNN
jgi:hypothetical protein